MKRLLPGLVFVLVASWAPHGHAATLIVDPGGGTPYPSIQSAIQAAEPGDDVRVLCGQYYENVLMKDGVSVRGSGADCTAIVGDGKGSVVILPPAGGATVLEGFTIRGGDHQVGLLGAGVEIRGGSPVITRNVIAENGSSGNGYGLYFQGYSAAIDAPVITYNIIRDNSGCCGGGGIALSGAEGATIRSNLIDGNSAY